MENIITYGLVFLFIAITIVLNLLFKLIKKKEEILNAKFDKFVEELKKSIKHDSEAIEKERLEVWQEIGILQNLLYQPLYEKGDKVYFFDCRKMKEVKGEITEVLTKCGELPSYKVLSNKETTTIYQPAITAWE